MCGRSRRRQVDPAVGLNEPEARLDVLEVPTPKAGKAREVIETLLSRTSNSSLLNKEAI
jgi:hypothetical protein